MPIIADNQGIAEDNFTVLKGIPAVTVLVGVTGNQSIVGTTYYTESVTITTESSRVLTMVTSHYDINTM